MKFASSIPAALVECFFAIVLSVFNVSDVGDAHCAAIPPQPVFFWGKPSLLSPSQTLNLPLFYVVRTTRLMHPDPWCDQKHTRARQGNVFQVCHTQRSIGGRIQWQKKHQEWMFGAFWACNNVLLVSTTLPCAPRVFLGHPSSIPSPQELKKQRVEEGREADARGRGGGAEEHGGSGEGKPKPIFLDKMRGEHVDAMGLEERMKRNRHYHQRGADVHNFMDRG